MGSPVSLAVADLCVRKTLESWHTAMTMDAENNS